MKNKEAIIVTMSSLKGGTGKSTLLSNFASYLANKNEKVLGIDLDYQMDLSSNFSHQISSTEMNKCSILNIFKHDAKDPTKPINFHPTQVSKNIDLISSDKHLDDVDEIMSKRPSLAPFVLMHIIYSLKLKDKYDWILIDTHNNFQTLTKNAFIVSNFILSPVTESRYSIKAVGDMLSRLKDLKKSYYDVKLGHSDISAKLFFIGNRISLSTNLSKQFAKLVKNDNHFITGFHNRSLFQKATSTYNSIYSYTRSESSNYHDRKLLKNEISPEFTKIEKIIKNYQRK